jgi:hypothetical protein
VDGGDELLRGLVTLGFEAEFFGEGFEFVLREIGELARGDGGGGDCGDDGDA